MVLLCSLCLIVFAILGYCRYHSFVAPAFLAPISWGAVLLLYSFADINIYPLSNKVLGVIMLWNICMLIGIYFFSEINIRNTKKRCFTKSFNPTIRNIYYFISLIGTPYLLYIAYQQARSIGPGNFWLNLRLANTGIVKADIDVGVFAYVYTFTFVAFLVEMIAYRKEDSRKRVIVLFFLNVLLSIGTMAKTSFLFLFVSAMLVYMTKKHVSMRKIIVIMVCLFVVMTSINFLRSAENDDNTILGMLSSYTLGGVAALDQIVQANTYSASWGQCSFVFFRNVADKIGVIQKTKNVYGNDIFDKEGYLYVPFPTNVSTVIGTFWLDFGYAGVILFAFFIGVWGGRLYRLYQKKVLWGIVSYTYFACVFSLQFFGEYIFTNLSYTLQLILLSYVVYKCNIIIKWKKSISYSPRSMESAI